jgi:NAD(P)-dependent dehydrogenase (short-subunit alcohol dehydrogenase family)
MSYNPFSLENKTVLVTGASSGIGQATAIECSKLGAKLIITARNIERLQETFSQLEGGGHQQIVADLTVSEDLDRLVESIPLLDGLVNNAGIGNTLPIQFIKETDLETILKVNTFSPVLLTKSLYKKKKFNIDASVVFTSSIGGVFAFGAANSIYGMSKSAVNSFMKFSAREFSTRKIRCNCVSPGMIETPFIYRGKITEEDFKKNKEQYPLKRYGQPNEVAWAIIYLLSDASAWVTGTNLVIDGGVSI